MLIKTHLAIIIFFILLFIPAVGNKMIFPVVALIATFLPDIDSRFSTIGKKPIIRILNFFTKHRGMIHSFTFLLSLTIILVLVFPVAAFGFFLGYGLHLLADSFTLQGIRPFYPFKKKSEGRLRTGSLLEKGILVGLIIANIALSFERVSGLF